MANLSSEIEHQTLKNGKREEITILPFVSQVWIIQALWGIKSAIDLKVSECLQSFLKPLPVYEYV